MRKIKEVLRLRHELGLHQEQIARSCSIGQSTVHRYLERAEAAQLVWPLAEDWDDATIEQLLFPVKVGFKAAAIAPIDFKLELLQVAETLVKGPLVGLLIAKEHVF